MSLTVIACPWMRQTATNCDDERGWFAEITSLNQAPGKSFQYQSSDSDVVYPLGHVETVTVVGSKNKTSLLGHGGVVERVEIHGELPFVGGTSREPTIGGAGPAPRGNDGRFPMMSVVRQ